MGPGALDDILSGLNIPGHPDLLVGFEGRDDAGVFRLNDDTALVQTLDFFTPMVDDPYVFGQIAAVNALNDVYAMGGRPLLAMNVVCFPECEDKEVLRQILAGGLSKINEAGALLVGGHTVDDNEPKYGLAVTGVVHPGHITSNNGAQPGDLLILTKPLGSGIITTALKAEMASKPAVEEAIGWMSALNRAAAESIEMAGAHAATDITGFGLAGHLMEMAAASRVTMEIYTDKLHFMQEALNYARMGLIPAGAYRNRDYLAANIIYRSEVEPAVSDLVFSPETAGGMLIAMDQSQAEALKAEMARRNCPAWVIGQVLEPSAGEVVIR